MSPFAWAGLSGLLVAAAWLRLWCCRGELWLDEVWTWDISRKLTWPGGLFYQLQEENNHYINTLMVWLFRNQSGWWFRLPAAVCGVASVAIAFRLGRTSPILPKLTGWLAAVLSAGAYLLVHYSSEARGYSYAVFFAALAFDQLWVLESSRTSKLTTSDAARAKRVAEWLFPIACCGGFLSQPIFLTCFGAMVVWMFLRLQRQLPSEQLWPSLMRLFLKPGLFFVVLYLVDLRHAANGGGDQFPLWRVVVETLSLTGGGPFRGGFAFVVAGLVLAAFGHGLRVLAREGDDRWIFLLLVVVVMPMGLLVVLRRAEVYPRYFLIAVFFLIQAAAVGLADLYRRGLVPGIVASVGLAGVMFGSGQHVQQLATLGRNQYVPILELLAEREPSSTIQIRSDHDFRHPLMFRYLLPQADMRGKSLEHVNHEKVPAEGTEWLLTHSLDVDWSPPATREVRGVAYELQSFRPYAGLSGWGLALYRKKGSHGVVKPRFASKSMALSGDRTDSSH
ncbi:MAG: hypothetical protein U0929_03015 [Planctomycetaceae bacterium]